MYDEYDTVTFTQSGSSLIYTKTMKECSELVTKVFSILQEKDLAVAAHKLFFHVWKGKFLKYIIKTNSAEISTRKIEVV
jgi:hypothetical protein